MWMQCLGYLSMPHTQVNEESKRGFQGCHGPLQLKFPDFSLTRGNPGFWSQDELQNSSPSHRHDPMNSLDPGRRGSILR